MTEWIFRLLALPLCQILSYVFVITNLMYMMVITNFNSIQCVCEKYMSLHSFLRLHFNEKYIQEELFCFAVTFKHLFLFF